VRVSVAEGPVVGVAVTVGVALRVKVGDGDEVGVTVPVLVGIGVLVTVALSVAVAVLVAVAVRVGEALGVAVPDGVRLTVGVAGVGVSVAVTGVGVPVAVPVADGWTAGWGVTPGWWRRNRPGGRIGEPSRLDRNVSVGGTAVARGAIGVGLKVGRGVGPLVGLEVTVEDATRAQGRPMTTVGQLGVAAW
jgi:hypothetical protein